MRDIRFIRLAALAPLTTLLLTAAYAFSGGKPDIRGTVSQIRRAEGKSGGRILGSVFVEGAKETDTQVDKAVITVTSETRLLVEQGDGREPASFAELKEGQKVEARFVGPVLESYPVRATAGEIIILRR